MQRVLITGHTGFVGTRLVQVLENDYLIEGIDRKEGDDALSCILPDGIDIVYHLAAHKSVEESWRDPVLYVENLTTLVRLATAYPDAKFIHASSCAGNEPINSPYGFFKKVAGDYLKTFHKNYVNLIFPNIYGGQQKQNSVVDVFKGKDEVEIHGDGTQVRDYVHVDDIVTGLVLAKDWPIGEYSMGSEIGKSILDLAEGKTVTFKPARSKEPKETVIPNTTPNWQPSINVMDYLNE